MPNPKKKKKKKRVLLKPVHYWGRIYKLTRREYALLQFMDKAEGEVITREEALPAVWGAKPDTKTSVFERTVNNLKRKLYRGDSKAIIMTYYGTKGWSLHKFRDWGGRDKRRALAEAKGAVFKPSQYADISGEPEDSTDFPDDF
jgi:DNA-binding winged helix-turn-helix (wHTH) protein